MNKAHQDSLPGSARPARRLAVSPGWEQALRSRLAGALRVPTAFPLAPPNWPSGVAKPVPKRTLGVDYDSEWARRPAARAARALVAEALGAPALRALAAPKVEGLDRLSHLDEPLIFAANHASHLDAPLLASVIPLPWRRELFVAGAADYFFDTRAKAIAFAALLNAVPIERTRVSRRSADKVCQLLEEGWSMVIFPEGGRSPDGWGQAHKPGTAWLAVRTHTPVVPVHIEGTRQILAKGSARIRPGQTTVRFGRPLRPSPKEDARALAARLEAEMAALADEGASGWYQARRHLAEGTTPSLYGPDGSAWRRAWALGPPRASRRKRRSWPRI